MGQRLFFLHDGRTTDLLEAIRAHDSDDHDCATTLVAETFVSDPGNRFVAAAAATFSCGSEANKVVDRFNALSTGQKQDILNFLRSL